MLTCIHGIGPKTKQKLNNLGIFTPIDLLLYFPKKYINFDEIADLSMAIAGDFCIAEVQIKKSSSPLRRGRLQLFKIKAKSGDKDVEIVWFNQNYLSKQIKIGQRYIIYGKLQIDRANILNFVNPKIEKKDSKRSQFSGINPIYRTKGLLSQNIFKKLIENVSNINVDLPPIIISEQLEKKYNLMSFKKAIIQLHQPTCLANIKQAEKRINIEQLVRRLAGFKLENEQKKARVSFSNSQFALKDFFKFIPFELTTSQKDAIHKIINMLSAGVGDKIMLCGDVGSGKTIVALAIANFAIKNGYQVALMAPTEILAQQHFIRAKKIFDKLNINVALLTASTATEDRELIINHLRSGKVKFIIGTHSLLNEKVSFLKLGLVVLDEQHKFGVAQRTSLISKGDSCPTLTLTATPIPRSLQLIAYGEIEYISIKKRYENNVKTFIVNKTKRNDMFKHIANLCNAGQKAVVIVPRIEDNEGIDISSVQEIYQELANKYFSKQKIACLHGQQREEQKQRTIKKFFADELSVIVATSILEVGMDLPDLTIMVILDAERFGLSTLHQLRGRVGRQGQEAMCFLYTEAVQPRQLERLYKIKECNDGMEIAEYDYLQRGAGDILGVQQTGQGEFSFINSENLQLAKQIVNNIDLQSIAPKLQGEIMRNELYNVSFS